MTFVQTVTGPVAAETCGVTLSHEHIFLDLRNQYTAPATAEQRVRGETPVSRAQADLLRRNPYALRDNLLLDDPDLMADELAAFKAAGGQTVVDCTSIGIRRDPLRLREISIRTGLHVVAGCGYYTRDTHPPHVAQATAETLAREMLVDLEEGIDGTGIRAGIIGEIGAGDPVHPQERKCLEAAAMASALSGCAIQVHTYPWGFSGLEAADCLIGAGTEPSRIVVCHTDVVLNMPYIRQLLERGVIVQFDNFGKEFQCEVAGKGFAGGRFAGDDERVRALLALMEDGFADRLLMTTDICLKNLLRRFGGNGYAHILDRIVPRLRAGGVSPAMLEQLLIDNPRRMLCPAIHQRP